MAQLYLFPCDECECKIEIQVKQAGRDLTCPQCQANLTAPTLTAIRRLEPVPTPGDAPHSATTGQGGHTGLRGWLFSGGLVIAVLAGAAGVALWFYANSLISTADVESLVRDSVDRVDQMKPAELWDYWFEMTEDALPEWQETVAQGQSRQGENLKMIALALFGLAGAGLIGIIAGITLKRR